MKFSMCTPASLLVMACLVSMVVPLAAHAEEFVCVTEGKNLTCKNHTDVTKTDRNLVIIGYTKHEYLYLDPIFLVGVALEIVVPMVAFLLGTICNALEDGEAKKILIMAFVPGADLILLSISQYHYNALIEFIMYAFGIVCLGAVLLLCRGTKKKSHYTTTCGFRLNSTSTVGRCMTLPSGSVYSQVHLYSFFYCCGMFLAQTGLMRYLIKGLFQMEDHDHKICPEAFLWGIVIQLLLGVREIGGLSTSTEVVQVVASLTHYSGVQEDRFDEAEEKRSSQVGSSSNQAKRLGEVGKRRFAKISDSKDKAQLPDQEYRVMSPYEGVLRGLMIVGVDYIYLAFILVVTPFILADLDDGLEFVKDALSVAFVIELDDKPEQKTICMCVEEEGESPEYTSLSDSDEED